MRYGLSIVSHTDQGIHLIMVLISISHTITTLIFSHIIHTYIIATHLWYRQHIYGISTIHNLHSPQPHIYIFNQIWPQRSLILPHLELSRLSQRVAWVSTRIQSVSYAVPVDIPSSWQSHQASRWPISPVLEPGWVGTTQFTTSTPTDTHTHTHRCEVIWHLYIEMVPTWGPFQYTDAILSLWVFPL